MGFVLGSLAGSALFPTQLPSGPHISDNRTTTSILGNPVPIVFGTATVAGTVIWLAKYVEHKDSSGGKGGPQQTTYSYTQSIALGLCESIIDGDPAIGGISRIWENGTLVYDIRPQHQANTFLRTKAETDIQYANRLTISAAYARTFTLYLGTESQRPDPTMEAVEGLGMVPAFRGLAYIVYPNRKLQLAQGQRHPNFQFEVFQQSIACQSTTEYSNDVLHPWDPTNLDPRTIGNTYTYQFWPPSDGHVPPIRDSLEQAQADAIDGVGVPYTLQPHLYGWNTTPDVLDAGTLFPVDADRGFVNDSQPYNDQETLYMMYNRYDPVTKSYVTVDASHQVEGHNDTCDFILSNPTGFWWIGDILDVNSNLEHNPGHGVYFHPFAVDQGSFNCATAGSTVSVLFVPDHPIMVKRAPGPPPDPCFGLPPVPGLDGYCIRGDGKYIRGGTWTKDVSQQYHVLQRYSAATQNYNHIMYPLGPALPIGSAQNTQAFWEAAYNAAPKGTGPNQIRAGLVYGADYPATQQYGWMIDSQVCAGSGGAVSVASIISAISQRAGLTALDVSDMETQFVDGYAIATVCNAVAIITPLRSVAAFDAVETGGLLKFQARGKGNVAALTTDDIGAYDAAGTGANVPPSVITTRSQDVDLPRSIRFHYIATSRDYEDAQQQSPFRVTTRAVNDVDVTVAIALGDTQALRCAEVLWSDSWAARDAYEIAVDQSWFALDVGDCIAIPVDGIERRVRIVSDTIASGVLRKLSCVRDDDGAYVSVAVAEPPLRQAQTLTFIGPTVAEFLDLPALQDADSDPGFYVAAQRQSDASTWKGCVVYQSLDAGASFAPLFSLVTEATVGTVASVVPASESFTWDTVTVITVTVADAGITFESVSDDAVLAGGNAAAMGADGRWEIVQFATATQVSATQWHLSRLLRGRRGTEYVMGTSQVGDAFVIVSTGDLNRVLLNTSEIGANRIYKVVSIGAGYSSGTDTTFAGHGRALFPFAPVDALAARQLNGDIVLSWTRRDRLGRTLMSGVDMPLSEATLAFQVDILSTASPPTVLRTLSTSVTQALYTRAMQLADLGGSSPAPSHVNVAIYQMSAIVGRGAAALASLPLISGGGGGGPPPTTHALTVTFGGTFNASNDTTILAVFTPYVGAAASYSWHLIGASKSSIADYATDLAAKAAASFGSHATVAVVSDVVTISSTTGTFIGSNEANNPTAAVATIRPAMPPSAGVNSIFYIDSYTVDGSLSPGSDPGFNTTATVTRRFVVHAYDEEVESALSLLQLPPVPAGLAVGDVITSGFAITVAYSVGGSAGSSMQNVYNIAAAINASSAFVPYRIGATPGTVTGTPDGTMSRPAVSITMKPGYYLAIDSLVTRAATPSGYYTQVALLRNGQAIYSSGAAKRVTVTFADAFDGSTGTYYSVLTLGQVYQITIDGTTYSHTVDSTDMADPRTDLGVTAYYRDGIYADLKAQLEATSNYTCTLFKYYRVPGGPATWVEHMIIERTAANVDFTCAASVPFSLNVSLTVT